MQKEGLWGLSHPSGHQERKSPKREKRREKRKTEEKMECRDST